MLILYHWNNLNFLCLNSGGHYIAYCRNNLNNLWYEFDDQSVTEVSESTVQNAEAYVLFYRWGNNSRVGCFDKDDKASHVKINSDF